MTKTATGVPCQTVRMFGCVLRWMSVASLVAATPASAQHVLQGRVTDTTNAGLPGVEVVLPALKQTATTDAEGYYRIVDVPGGPRRIVMRKIGFQPLNSFHTLIADTVTLDVRMAPLEVQLPTIEVTVRGLTPVPGKLRAWAERRERGRGTFFDDAFLRQNEHLGLKDVLRRVNGLRFVRFADRAGVAASAGARSTAFTLAPRTRPKGVPNACYMTVYVDGAMVYTEGNDRIRPPNLEDYNVYNLAAIEVFRSAAEIPPEMNAMGSDCGVISLWTR